MLQRNTLAGQLGFMHNIAATKWFNRVLALITGTDGNNFRAWVNEVTTARLQSVGNDERPDMFTLFRNSKEASGEKITNARLIGECMTVL